jgi:solute:Na+ symporter, SSS family
MHVLDQTIVVLYLLAMLAIGFYFFKQKNKTNQYSKTTKPIPGWALGLSFYATFLSAITFLGDPGKSFASNWNPFVFSLSMPFAAYFASKYFVPFYRNATHISAYTHLGQRFGTWAANYTVLCFILTQLARIGTILYAISLAINALTNLDIRILIVLIGIIIVLYTLLGGLEAIIWTEVLQAIIKTLGALLVLYLVLSKISFAQVVHSATAQQKFSLGSFAIDFRHSSFLVVFLYGFFINLGNFGIDQNYIQRYHTAANQSIASRSIWLCVLYYLPVSALFFFLGTCLFAYYQAFPDLLGQLQQTVALEKNIHIGSLNPTDYADKVFPYFMKTEIPCGFLGLLVAALLAAGMSAISNGINSAATVIQKDIFKQKHGQEVQLIRYSIVAMGIAGVVVAWLMIGAKSLLDVWWKLAGAMAGGMLGLFLLGYFGSKISNYKAALALCLGVVVILWVSFPQFFPRHIQSTLDPKMNVVLGTIVIVALGYIWGKGKTF